MDKMRFLGTPPLPKKFISWSVDSLPWSEKVLKASSSRQQKTYFIIQCLKSRKNVNTLVIVSTKASASCFTLKRNVTTSAQYFFMKQHVKPCRYGEEEKNCRHAEICAFSHKKDTNNKESNGHLVSITNSLKELHDYNLKSEVKMLCLEEELRLVKSMTGKEKSMESSPVSKMNKLEVDLNNFKVNLNC